MDDPPEFRDRCHSLVFPRGNGAPGALGGDQDSGRLSTGLPCACMVLRRSLRPSRLTSGELHLPDELRTGRETYEP